MKKENPRPFALSHVKATGDGDSALNFYGKIEGVRGTRSKILAGIKNEL
jgi:hypothetical protein